MYSRGSAAQPWPLSVASDCSIWVPIGGSESSENRRFSGCHRQSSPGHHARPQGIRRMSEEEHPSEARSPARKALNLC
jgi:hypothetical protein